MNIIFLGPPGVGKGTHSKLLIKRYDLNYIATGDILRAAVENKTALGQEAMRFMQSGTMVPDPLILNLISERLKELDKTHGFALDGFPRTLNQGQALTEMLEKEKLLIDHVLYLHAPEEVLVERIINRAKESLKPRADDIDEKIVRHRLKIFLDDTYPLVDYYKSKVLLRDINGDGEIEEIHLNILSKFESSQKIS